MMTETPEHAERLPGCRLMEPPVGGLRQACYTAQVETKWLEDFVSLAETRSFSRAAQLRHITQPAFSRRIQALEAWAGVDLVDRSAYPTRLTPAGQTLYGQALEILQSLQAVVGYKGRGGSDLALHCDLVVMADDGTRQTYPIGKFQRSNAGNSYNQRVLFDEGDRVEAVRVRSLESGHDLVLLGRDVRPLRDRFPGATAVRGDLLDPATLPPALEGVELAYYLAHSMGPTSGPSGSHGDFAERDRVAAANFATAAKTAGVGRIVYLGGLGSDDDPKLSHHLASRHETGAELARHGVPVTEFRAAIVIGSGSASFEMLRTLTERREDLADRLAGVVEGGTAVQPDKIVRQSGSRPLA